MRQTVANLPNPPTAIFAAAINPLGTYQAARKRIKNPRDLSIVGFGQHTRGRQADPGLTTVDQYSGNGKIAVQMLVMLIEGRILEIKPSKLHAGQSESCRAISAAGGKSGLI
jgi:DNA-binding LacI/PurR family transcriptional regulator